MASDMVMTTHIAREETRCRHIGYSLQGFFFMHHPTDRIRQPQPLLHQSLSTG